MHHSFDISIAEKYSVNVAIFLNNMAYWIRHNIANEQHFYDNRYWTYNSVKSYSFLFPYWTLKQMRTVLDQCEKHDLIVKGKYNKRKYDQTQWYALTDLGLNLLNITICPKGQMELPQRANGIAPKGKPIPIINTDINTYKSLCASDDARVSFDLFWNIYPKKKNKKRALECWIKFECHKIAETILNNLRKQVLNDVQWQNVQFIPHPTTYISGERWNDEVTLSKPNPKSEASTSTVKEWGPGHPSWESIHH